MKNFEMKIVITIILLAAMGLLFSCHKDQLQEQQPTSNIKNLPVSEATASLPDLVIEELSYEYDGWINGYGLRYTGTNFHLVTENGVVKLMYNCPIGNIAPQKPDRSTNFFLKMSEWGTQVGSSNYYSFNGFLEAVLFENGLPVDTLPKNIFYTYTTDHKLTFEWALAHDYQYDTMYVEAQGADLYNPKMKVRQANGVAINAEYVIAVTINPEHKFPEASYDNNTSVLPFKVFNNTALLDLSAIDKNKTQPATNLTGYHGGRNVKKVFLDWDCPYHEPIHITHWFTIYRDGILIADNVDPSEYTDNVSGNYKGATYTVVINVPGLGASVQTSKYIPKQ